MGQEVSLKTMDCMNSDKYCLQRWEFDEPCIVLYISL